MSDLERESMNHLLYIGSYTTKASLGMYAYRFDPATGKLHALGLAAETKNPSFLACNANRKLLYAVVEVDNYCGKWSGAIRSYSVHPETGVLTFLNEVSSAGAGPCYLSLDKAARHALAANFNSGSIAVFPVMQDGGLGPAKSFLQHHGKGADPERQEGPHTHAIATSPDSRFALVTDLGLDRLSSYGFDADTGTVVESGAFIAKTPDRSGPRHFAFHPGGNFVYLVCELNSTITTFTYDSASGSLCEIQTADLLPAGFSDYNIAAHVQVNATGRFLYASNRGHDSIAVFAIHPVSGVLRLVEHVSTGGKKPRHFAIDPSGRFMLVANQDSDSLTVFCIDQISGRLTPTGKHYEAPTPLFVLFFC